MNGRSNARQGCLFPVGISDGVPRLVNLKFRMDCQQKNNYGYQWYMGSRSFFLAVALARCRDDLHKKGRITHRCGFVFYFLFLLLISS